MQAVRTGRVQAVEVRRLAKHLAFADPALLVDERGHPVSLGEIPAKVRVAVKSLEMIPFRYDKHGKVTAYAYRYRFADKNSALDKLFRHLGLYEKETGQVGGGVRALMEAIHASGNRIPLKP